METSGGIRASLAGRYASALFDLARDAKQIESVSRSLDTLKAALAQSPDLAALSTRPLIGRGKTATALGEIARALSLDPLTTKFLGVLANNGRLAQLPTIIRDFGRLAAEHRGETTAEVTSAHPLGDDQLAALTAQLTARAGRAVTIDARVDPAILGGIAVKIGSRMIDGSVRTKLNTLAQAMRG